MFNLTPYLEDIERRINIAEEEAIWSAWVAFAEGKNTQAPFNPPARTPSQAGVEWKHVNVNDALEDEDLMLLSQLERCHAALSRPSDTIMMMRANYGVGNISRLFGAEPFIMPYEMDTLPNVRPIPGGADGIRRLLEQDIPDMNSGGNHHIWSVGEKLAEICRKYPKIGKYVIIDNPDAQGPMDNCELLWGSDIFCDMYDEPELVHAFLNHLTETIRVFIEKWTAIHPNKTGLASYFGRVGKGGIVLRNDSAMNLSPEFFREFIMPYDSRLLQHFGGGTVHFCGRGDHFIRHLVEMPGLTAVDMSQPHLNDMQIILSNTIDQGINLFVPYGDYSTEGHTLTRLNAYGRSSY